MRKIIKDRLAKPNGFIHSPVPLRIHSSPDLTCPSRKIPASQGFLTPVLESRQRVPEMDPLLTIKGVVTSQDGYVLLDLESPFIREAMADIAKSAQIEGIEMRSKPINHVTLARDRHDDAEKEAIAALWDEALTASRPEPNLWRVVVYELLERTPLDELATKGPHQLSEIISIPLRSSPPEKSVQDRGVSAPRIWVC
jgi:hypothetical protein